MNNKKLKTLVDRFETPFYVIDLDMVRQRYEKLVNTLPFISVRYASKSNFDPQLIKTLNDLDAQYTTGSSQEATICYNLGADLDNIQVTAVSPKKSSIRQLVKMSEINRNVSVNINDKQTLSRLLRRGYKGNIVLRFKPKYELQDTSKYTDGSRMKFGMKKSEIRGCMDLINNSEASFKGFHSHLGGTVYPSNIGKFYEHVEHTLEQVRVHRNLDEVDSINFGGGLSCPTKPSDDVLDLTKFRKDMRDILPSSSTEYVIEPGKFVSGPTMSLLTKAQMVRGKDPIFVGVDAGMSDFLRPTMFDINIHITNLYEKNSVNTHTVSGPTCSGADMFCHNQKFGTTKKDDILALNNIGAYSVIMTTQFHGYESPKCVSLQGEVSEKISKVVSERSKL